MKRGRFFEGLIVATCILAVVYFGGQFALHLIRMEVEKAAMELRIDQIIDPAERLWILGNIHAELESNHVGDRALFPMTLIELINRPSNEFPTLLPGRLGLLRRLYLKFRIMEGEE